MSVTTLLKQSQPQASMSASATQAIPIPDEQEATGMRPMLVAKPTQEVPVASPGIWVGIIALSAIVIRGLILMLGPLTEATRAVHPASEQMLDAASKMEHSGLWLTTAAGLESPIYGLLLGFMLMLDIPAEFLLMAQCLFGALAAWLTFLLLRTLMPKRMSVAYIGAWIVALHPAAITASNAIVPDVFLLVLLVGGLLVVARQGQDEWVGGLLGGLLIGLAALIQPASALLGVAAAAWILLTTLRWRALTGAVAFAVTSCAPLLVWVVVLQQQPPVAAWEATIGSSPLAENSPPIEQQFNAVLLADHTQTLFQQFGLSTDIESTTQTTLADHFRVDRGADVQAGWVALSWSAINAVIVIVALLGIGLMLARRQWEPATFSIGLLVWCLFLTTGFESTPFELPLVLG
ncbi:MAG: hypothetical protein MI741_15495, partial [Rhodospirillales bacterium]|nr:hypothetical protein [Rhodospirillales bacterium]